MVRTRVEELKELYEELYDEFKALSQALGVSVSLDFHSLGVEELVIERKNKTYSYLQLKAVYSSKKEKTKSRTLRSYRIDECPLEELKRLVDLYKAIKHCEHLLNVLRDLNMIYKACKQAGEGIK